MHNKLQASLKLLEFRIIGSATAPGPASAEQRLGWGPGRGEWPRATQGASPGVQGVRGDSQGASQGDSQGDTLKATLKLSLKVSLKVSL